MVKSKGMKNYIWDKIPFKTAKSWVGGVAQVIRACLAIAKS
jgi:hypothetical protein